MKFKSVGTRIVISVIPTIIITIVLFVLISYNSSERNTNKMLEEKMQQNIYTANIELTTEIHKNSAIAENLAVYAKTIINNYSDSKIYNNEDIMYYLSELLKQNTNTIAIGIYYAKDKFNNSSLYDNYYSYTDTSGNILTTFNYSDYVDYLNEDWYINAKNSDGKISWSYIYIDPFTEKYVITASIAFYNADGEFLGVAIADMALDNVQRIVDNIAIDNSGKAFIISRIGRYITFYDDSRTVEDLITDEEDPEWKALGELLIQPVNGKTTFNNNGREELIYYITMEDIVWTLAIVYDLQERNINRLSDFLSTIIVPVIGLSLVIFGVFLIIRYLHRIINKVNHFSKLAATGDLTEHIDITETDEFGNMEQYLNTMISNMDEMNNESKRLLEQAQAANVAKSDFLSRMSHEIRTPMTAIIGMTQIAKSTGDVSKIQNCLGKIDNASRHLLNLINDILDMSKIEANKFELNKEHFNFMNCIKNIYNVVNIKAEEKNLQFTINVDDNVPAHIIGDEMRITQIFTNLIGNSIKFTPKHGIISVYVKETKRDDHDSIIEVSIVDNGIGISKEQQSRLFNSFEQADGSISRKYGGTGLGLTICKRMVEMMNGCIWVESEVNKGSTFVFTMKVERGTDMLIKDAPKTIKNCRILTVDDSKESIDYMQHILKNFSLTCDAAENGMDAIDMVINSIRAKRPYNVIFMDYFMPGLNGIETAKKINEIANESISIIMVSISDWNEIENEAKNAGITKHITKPVSPSSVLDKIYNAINSSTQNAISKMDLSGRDFSSNNILLVEDNEINVEIVIALLEDTKVNIDIAENGVIACQKFAADPDKYDLIFMDIQMPDMDGYEATKQIRSMDVPNAKTIPIIAMTANAFREDYEKCIEAGMVDHISKPIDSEVLLIKLNDYIFMKEFLNRDIY